MDCLIDEVENDVYTIEKVQEFLNLSQFTSSNKETKEAIKELCVAKLCKTVGLTGKYNYKSEFFNFFSSIVGEAICERLNIKIHIASDELRLFKYEHINLIDKVRGFFNENLEEAFLNSFNLIDYFKYLIPQLKKV